MNCERSPQSGLNKVVVRVLSALAVASLAFSGSSTFDTQAFAVRSPCVLAESKHSERCTPKSDSTTEISSSKTAEMNREKEQHYMNLVEDIISVVEEKFVDQKLVTDSKRWQSTCSTLRKMKIRSDQEYHTAMQWALARLDDPFTRFLTPSELDSLKSDLDGNMTGIGVVISKCKRSKYLFIHETIPSSPAHRAGIVTGNYITEIDGKDTRVISLDDAHSALLGKEGSAVIIRIICPEKTYLDDRFPAESPTKTIELVRRDFGIPSVMPANIWLNSDAAENQGPVVYIRVREFSSQTARETRKALKHLRTLSRPHTDTNGNTFRNKFSLLMMHLNAGAMPHAYIIDLRSNAGGVLTEAIHFSKIFIHEPYKRIVSFLTRDEEELPSETSNLISAIRSKSLVNENAPIFVLVDKYSASASELVAAALRDNCRAVIVGQRSYGKGSVQAVMQVSDNSGFAFTIARYLTPTGRPIVLHEGLDPDIPLRLKFAQDFGVCALNIPNNTISSVARREEAELVRLAELIASPRQRMEALGVIQRCRKRQQIVKTEHIAKHDTTVQHVKQSEQLRRNALYRPL